MVRRAGHVMEAAVSVLLLLFVVRAAIHGAWFGVAWWAGWLIALLAFVYLRERGRFAS